MFLTSCCRMTADLLIAVHPYRTACIKRPIFAFQSEYGDAHDTLVGQVDALKDEWLTAAKEAGLISSTFGINHIVFEFKGGMLAAWSDCSLTIGTGLRLGSW